MQGADLLYHLAARADWAEALACGVYTTSTTGLSLDDVGFIHCSFAEQVQGVADAFYRDRHDVVLLKIDPSRLASEVRVEAVGDTPGAFPHLYGPLPVASVIEAVEVATDPDGRLDFGEVIPKP